MIAEFLSNSVILITVAELLLLLSFYFVSSSSESNRSVFGIFLAWAGGLFLFFTVHRYGSTPGNASPVLQLVFLSALTLPPLLYFFIASKENGALLPLSTTARRILLLFFLGPFFLFFFPDYALGGIFIRYNNNYYFFFMLVLVYLQLVILLSPNKKFAGAAVLLLLYAMHAFLFLHALGAFSPGTPPLPLGARLWSAFLLSLALGAFFLAGGNSLNLPEDGLFAAPVLAFIVKIALFREFFPIFLVSLALVGAFAYWKRRNFESVVSD